MTQITNSLFFLATVIIGVSCTSTKQIQTNLNSSSYSLAYLQDSKIEKKTKGNISVAIDTVILNPNLISQTTTVIREKNLVVPLILINIWNSENMCFQGKSMMEEDMQDFMKSNLEKEIIRSGKFNIDSAGNAEFKIELTIEELSTAGPYKSSGFFYFLLFAYGYSYTDVAGPAISKIKVSYKLLSDGVVIFENKVNSQRLTEPINRHYSKNSSLQTDYAKSMVEATSFNIKTITELIVKDLNSFFENI